jgi:hypothetical protein
MNDAFPFVYWYSVGGVLLLALVTSYFLYTYWYKPKSFKS